ncbi:MAG: hypothetical protein ACXABY_22915, partial [Candidatus Thorarchaeota archaeon]
FDRSGRVVPAGLKTAFAVTSGDVLTYAAADVTELTVDLTTGVAVAAAGGYDRAALSAALIARGLLDAGENAEDFISFPVGVAPYNYLSWAGGDGFNPALQKQTNYNMQHRVAILCKYVVEMPLVPASHSGIDLAAAAAITDTAISDWTDADTDGGWYSSTSLAATTRYANDVTAGDDVVGLNLPVMDLAKDTVLCPIVVPTGFTREVASIGEIAQAGDYFIDYDVGMFLIFETDGNAAAVASGNVTFYHYEDLPSTVSAYACALGDLKPGDFVRANADSNFVKAQVIIDTDVEVVTSEDPETSLSSDELAGLLNLCSKRQDEIIGQVLDSDLHPKDYLERVRTAYPQLGTLDQMPGSASAGLPAQLTYAGGSNKMIRILLLR